MPVIRPTEDFCGPVFCLRGNLTVENVVDQFSARTSIGWPAAEWSKPYHASVRRPSCTSHSDSQPRRSPHRQAVKLTSLAAFAHPLLVARVAVISVSKPNSLACMGQDPSRIAGLTRSRLSHLEAKESPFKWLERMVLVSASENDRIRHGEAPLRNRVIRQPRR